MISALLSERFRAGGGSATSTTAARAQARGGGVTHGYAGGLGHASLLGVHSPRRLVTMFGGVVRQAHRHLTAR